MLYAFRADESVSDSLDFRNPTAHDEHFQAVVVVEVNMQRGDDGIAMVVLKVRERLLHVMGVMVVNQRHRARRFAVAGHLTMLDQVIANHVGDGQGTVVVPFFVDHLVELDEKILFQGNAEAGNAFGAHGVTKLLRVTSWRQSGNWRNFEEILFLGGGAILKAKPHGHFHSCGDGHAILPGGFEPPRANGCECGAVEHAVKATTLHVRADNMACGVD